MKIWLDMDGTIANLYGVDNWLQMLIANDPTPYKLAKPLVRLCQLARLLNQLQRQGHEIGIISWLSKNSTVDYDMAVTNAKEVWLKSHMPSVRWDSIKIVRYGTNKHSICGEGILFDDEEQNRVEWGAGAYKPTAIFQVLHSLKY